MWVPRWRLMVDKFVRWWSERRCWRCCTSTLCVCVCVCVWRRNTGMLNWQTVPYQHTDTSMYCTTYQTSLNLRLTLQYSTRQHAHSVRLFDYGERKCVMIVLHCCIRVLRYVCWRNTVWPWSLTAQTWTPLTGVCISSCKTKSRTSRFRRTWSNPG
jgi:hypothetical protein